MRILIIFLAVITLDIHLYARNHFSEFDTQTQSIYINTSMNIAPALGVGYQKGFSIERRGYDFDLSADFNWYFLGMDFSDFRIDVNGCFPIFNRNGWGIMDQITLHLNRSVNISADAFSIAIENSIQPGYFGNRFKFALDLSYTGILTTYFNHSDWYKQNIYEDVKDGWYKGVGGTFRFGFILNFNIGKKMVLSINSGYYTSESFVSSMIPVYFTIGMAYTL